MTGYNWETNASNAGSDYLNQSDNYLTWVSGISDAAAAIPGIVLTKFHDQSLAANVPYSIITLPMAGYVAADKNGPVAAGEAAPSVRWTPVVNTKPTGLLTTPDLTDGKVYSDELVQFLVSRYGGAASVNGIKGYDLDNEPDLWSSTHSRLHPAKPLCTELISRSVDLAKAVKRIDPAAETLGFVSYGFGGYYDFQGATDWPTEKTKGAYRWFIDYYLDQMKQASTTAGVRLLNVLDLHNYSEAQGGGARVTDSTDYTNIDCNKARLQAPRAFWDPTYVENSWIGQYYSSFLPFLPGIKQSVATFYPGTKIGFSEYNFGGENHVSGGIAQADILGIFGKQGVYLASLWPLQSELTYTAAAFNLYRNYDSAGHQFGDTSVSASTADAVISSVYASLEGGSTNRLHLIVLNKSYDTATQFDFNVAGHTAFTSARVFAFDANSSTLTERTAVTGISGNHFSYTLPPLTAAHFILEAQSVGRSDFDGDGKSDLLWTNTQTGERSMWFLNGSTLSNGASLGVVPAAWVASAIADFDGDGKADIFWTNTVTGDRSVWLMNGSAVRTNTFLGTVPVDWVVSGVGDFNGDGKADLVWTNTTTGDRAMWLMNGSTVLGGG
ncbi:MAG: glycoside hydrolase family 44 protein, partial [Lacunisphaera sp.]